MFLYRTLQRQRTFQRAKRKEAAPSLVISAPAVCSLGSHWAALLCCFHCCSRCLMFAKQLCPFGHRSLCGVLCFFFCFFFSLTGPTFSSHSPVTALYLCMCPIWTLSCKSCLALVASWSWAASGAGSSWTCLSARPPRPVRAWALPEQLPSHGGVIVAGYD